MTFACDRKVLVKSNLLESGKLAVVVLRPFPHKLRCDSNHKTIKTMKNK
jgi:hypothetical protein